MTFIIFVTKGIRVCKKFYPLLYFINYKSMKNIAVFTGGGADGAVTVGRLKELNKSYDKAFCISTGSLLGPLALLKKYDKLEELYLSATQEKITDRSIFDKDGKLIPRKVIFQALATLWRKEKSLGSSKALREFIEQNLTEDEYKELSLYRKEVYVGCYSNTTEELVYFDSSEDFEDFKDWMWASANPPLAFSMLTKKRDKDFQEEEWNDGGVHSIIPILHALCFASKGDTVDIFMHSPRPIVSFKKKIKNAFHHAARLAKAKLSNIDIQKDLDSAIKLAKAKGVKVNIYWQAYEVRDNSLIFVPSEMKERLELGKVWATDETLIDRY